MLAMNGAFGGPPEHSKSTMNGLNRVPFDSVTFCSQKQRTKIGTKLTLLESSTSADVLAIGLRIHQGISLSGVRGLDLENPATEVGIAIE